MRDYQLYEILLFFALYSILGWTADRCVFALRRRKGGKGLCRGPYMPLFGAAALLIVAWDEPAARGMASWLGTDRDMTLLAAALCGLLAGGVCALAAALLARICSGRWLLHVSCCDLPLWMAGGVLVTMHLQPALTAVTRWISPWVHLIFLCVIYMMMTGDWIDGAANLFCFRKKGTISRETE